MALEFKVYEKEGGETLKSHGTVLSLIGQTGSINLIKNNFKSDKRVVAILKRDDNTSLQVTCSQGVSDDLRAGKINPSHLLSYEILEGESGVPFISGKGGLIEFSVASMKIEEVQPTAISFEDLLTY